MYRSTKERDRSACHRLLCRSRTSTTQRCCPTRLKTWPNTGCTLGRPGKVVRQVIYRCRPSFTHYSVCNEHTRSIRSTKVSPVETLYENLWTNSHHRPKLRSFPLCRIHRLCFGRNTPLFRAPSSACFRFYADYSSNLCKKSTIYKFSTCTQYSLLFRRVNVCFQYNVFCISKSFLRSDNHKQYYLFLNLRVTPFMFKEHDVISDSDCCGHYSVGIVQFFLNRF